jgi:hypothetical protein
VKKLKHITMDQAHRYVRLDQDDPWLHSRAVAYALVPSTNPRFEGEPGWEDMVYFGQGVTDPTMSNMKSEWVYVLVNKSMPGICKVGMTTTTVKQRVHEINSATGVITPWVCVYRYECINSYVLEQAVHRELESMGHRVNPNREGFSVSSELAIQTIERLGDRLTVTPEDFCPEPKPVEP